MSLPPVDSSAFVDYFDYSPSEFSYGDELDVEDLLYFPLRPAVFTDSSSSSSSMSAYSASTSSTSSYDADQSTYPDSDFSSGLKSDLCWSDLSLSTSPLSFELPTPPSFLGSHISYATGRPGRAPDANHSYGIARSYIHAEPAATVFLRDGQLSQSPAPEDERPTTCIPLKRSRSPSPPRWTERQGESSNPHHRRHFTMKRERSPSVLQSLPSQDDEYDADDSYHPTQKRLCLLSTPHPRKRARISEPDSNPDPAHKPTPKSRRTRRDARRRSPPPRILKLPEEVVKEHLANVETLNFCCPFCPYRQKSYRGKKERMPDFKRHIQSHKAKSSQFTCKGVLLTEASAYGIAHSASSHAYFFGNDWRIGGCKQEFSRADALRRHLRNRHIHCVQERQKKKT